MDKNNKSRRAFLLSSAALMVFGPVACSVSRDRPPLTINKVEQNPSFFKALADAIIPATVSPSASEVGAEIFACRVVTEARGQDINERFFVGAQDLENEALALFGDSFDNVSDQRRLDFLVVVLNRGDDDPASWFLHRFRQLILIGWALSEAAAKSAFNYQPHIYRYTPSTNNQKILMQSNLDRMYIDI